jgi:hypothetical protein
VELFLRNLVIHAYNDSVGMQKILDGRTFAKEFRIRGHAKFHFAFAAVDRKGALQFLTRLRGNGALLNHQLWRTRFACDKPSDVVNCAQVGAAIWQRRGSHTDKNRIAGRYRIQRVGTEL